VDAEKFLVDLERKPEVVRRLADVIGTGDGLADVPGADRVLMMGMGSSTYAAGVAAARLRSAGVDAVAEVASSDLLPHPDPGTLVVVVSASGGSRETVEAVQPYLGISPTVAMTNNVDSTLAHACDVVVDLRAEPEVGGVACRTYQHTVAWLLGLENHLLGRTSKFDEPLRRTADACADLLDRRREWLPEATGALAGPDGTWVVAPFRRLGNAQQSALMLREGPRRAAVACETGDWNHVDVYLTKTKDYRMLLLPGSGYEDELLRWTNERGSTVVAVGADLPGATHVVRYTGDDDDDVRLLSEVLVAELVAHALWSR